MEGNNTIYLTEQSILELLQGKVVYDDDTKMKLGLTKRGILIKRLVDMAFDIEQEIMEEARLSRIENAMMLLAKELHMEKQLEYEMFGRQK